MRRSNEWNEKTSRQVEAGEVGVGELAYILVFIKIPPVGEPDEASRSGSPDCQAVRGFFMLVSQVGNGMMAVTDSERVMVQRVAQFSSCGSSMYLLYIRLRGANLLFLHDLSLDGYVSCFVNAGRFSVPLVW